MKKIWILCLLLGLAACNDRGCDAQSFADRTEVRLVKEPQTGACFVVVMTTYGDGSLAVAPAPCPPPGAAPAEVWPAVDGGFR